MLHRLFGKLMNTAYFKIKTKAVHGKKIVVRQMSKNEPEFAKFNDKNEKAEPYEKHQLRHLFLSAQWKFSFHSDNALRIFGDENILRMF